MGRMEAGARAAEQEWVARLLDQARSALGEGDMPAAHRLLIAAKNRGPAGLDVDLAELEASVLLADGSLLPAAELLERAARQADPGRAAQLLAAAVAPSIAAGRVDQGLRLAEAARRVMPAEDEATRLRVHSAVADAYAAGGRWAEAVEVWGGAAEAAERAGLANEAETRLWLVEALHCGGLNDKARDLALVATREARQAGETPALTDGLQLLFGIEFRHRTHPPGEGGGGGRARGRRRRRAADGPQGGARTPCLVRGAPGRGGTLPRARRQAVRPR